MNSWYHVQYVNNHRPITRTGTDGLADQYVRVNHQLSPSGTIHVIITSRLGRQEGRGSDQRDISWQGGKGWSLWKLNSTQLEKNRHAVFCQSSREVLNMLRISQLTENWRLFCRVELSWVLRGLDSTDQLSEWPQHPKPIELSWVGRCDAIKLCQTSSSSSS